MFSQIVPKVLSLGITVQFSVLSCVVDFGICLSVSPADGMRPPCMPSCSDDGGGGGGGATGGHIGGTEDGLGDWHGSHGSAESVESALVLKNECFYPRYDISITYFKAFRNRKKILFGLRPVEVVKWSTGRKSNPSPNL